MKKKTLFNSAILYLKKTLRNTFDFAYSVIYDAVKQNDGFIALTDTSCDTIFGYAMNDEDELKEWYARGLRIAKNNDLEVFLAPILRGVKETYTKEDMFSDEFKDCWYSLSGADGALYSWETILGIIENLDEYLDE